MAAERCNEQIHKNDPRMYFYDWEYYKQLLPLISGDVLDIGAGAGMFIKEYIKKDEVTSVLAVDKYTDEIEAHEKLTVFTQDLPSEIQTDKKFDTIVSTEFVEHITYDDLPKMLKEIQKLLKPGGVFIGSTPNKISPTTNPYHLYEYTLNELVGIYKNYFTEVEAWDNGQNCTLWQCKL